MYTGFFGLHARPFTLTPDPAFLYQSRQHAMALTMLEYGLDSHAPLLLLTGEIGAGKTTLIRRLIRDLGDRVAVGLISNTHARVQSLFHWTLSALDLKVEGGGDVAAYEAIVAGTLAEYARGRRTLLIVDEAQNLADEVVEELRLLSNINSEQDLVLQIMLAGQPELRDMLQKPSMRQIAQRVAADFHLRALTRKETAAYVRHRLSVAGGAEDLFTPSALTLIHERTGGIPRLINQLCDYTLVYAFADQKRQIDKRVVTKVLRDREAFGALPLFAAPVTAAAPAATEGALPVPEPTPPDDVGMR